MSEREADYTNILLSLFICLASLYFIFYIFTHSVDMTLSNLRNIALRGNAKVAYQLANLYYSGNHDVPVNKSEAIWWYEKAVELGSAAAANDLGVMYSRGQDVKQENNKAKELYLRAARGGDYLAMYNLGLGYSGLEDATIHPSQDDYRQAIYWYTQSMNTESNVCAANDLGMLYASNKTVNQDSAKAKNYFTISADLFLHDKKIILDNSINKDHFLKVYAEYQYSESDKNSASEILGSSSPVMLTTVKDVVHKVMQQCRQ